MGPATPPGEHAGASISFDVSSTDVLRRQAGGGGDFSSIPCSGFALRGWPLKMMHAVNLIMCALHMSARASWRRQQMQVQHVGKPIVV